MEKRRKGASESAGNAGARAAREKKARSQPRHFFSRREKKGPHLRHVLDHRLPVGQRGRHHERLGGPHRGVVHVDTAAEEAAGAVGPEGGPGDDLAVADLDGGAHGLGRGRKEERRGEKA